MNILAINAYHPNASAALVQNGQLVAAVEEERFNRVKYAAGFPTQAIRYCLGEASLEIEDVHYVVVPRNPWARLWKKLFFAARLPRFPADRAHVMARFAGLHYQLAEALGVAPERIRAKFHRLEHHQAHLASAFFVSPFDQAALLSVDGLGDFASAMWGVGHGSKMEVKGDVAFPHSLGIFYTALTQYLGFWKFGDEYKVMGLGSYGEPAHIEKFRRIVKPGPGVGFRLGLEYFVHHQRGAEMTWSSADETPVLGQLYSDELEKLLGPARKAEEPLERQHQDLAASQQAALEEARRLGIGAHEGVYAAMHGPSYETPAEIRALRTLGADLVGMSTALQAIAARHLGAEVLAISLVTNLAAGLSAHGLDHGEVARLGAPTGEDDFAGGGTDERGDLVAGLLDGATRLARGTVRTRRVAHHAALPRRHRLGYFVTSRG